MNKRELSERDICTKFITPALTSAGWKQTQIREEVTFTKGRVVVRGKMVARGNTKRADYVLYHQRNIVLAVIEAKDSNHSVGDGMQQALDYAESLDVPFAFSSNGDGFVFHDRTGTSDQRESNLRLQDFPGPDVLWNKYLVWRGLTPEAESIVLQDYHEDSVGKEPRYYQINAVNAVTEAIAKGRDRVLLIMATGTGKTYTVFQIIWRLWKAGLKKRILFLADRNVLVDQTMVNDFRPFGGAMTKLSTEAKTIQWTSATTRSVDTAYEVYLALYQAITGPEENQKVYRRLSPSFFDLIVIDECHRGSAADDSAWREILEYFSSATQIGLTATPRETKYGSNISYFGEPVYTYSLKQGILDGFLAPYKVVRMLIDRDVEGYRPELGKLDRDGQEVEDRIYGVDDYDKTLVIDERTQLVASKITTFMKQSGDRYQKVIVFRVDQEHAARMRQALVNENSDLVDENQRYVMRITGDDREGQAELSNFIDPESSHPVMVTTSRLLSTGVDVQTCRLIVIDRIVGSMPEFKQIMGRGTRLHEESGKLYFTLIDFRGATRHFADPEFDGEPVQIYEPDEGDPIEPPDLSGANDDVESINDVSSEPTPPPLGRRKKVYVDGVSVDILAEQVQYLDQKGNLVTESLRDFTRRTLRNRFANLDDFLRRWNASDHKQAVVDEIEDEGFPLTQVAAELDKRLDPFDVVCHFAFDASPLTRSERAQNVRAGEDLSKYGEQARAVLAALLDKYADEGVLHLDDAELLRIPPISELGTPMELVRAFGDRSSFERAVLNIQSALYREAA